MTLEQINNELKRGDKVRIAENVGCGFSTVKAILSGDRNSETELGQKIIQAATQIIEFNNMAEDLDDVTGPISLPLKELVLVTINNL